MFNSCSFVFERSDESCGKTADLWYIHTLFVFEAMETQMFCFEYDEGKVLNKVECLD